MPIYSSYSVVSSNVIPLQFCNLKIQNVSVLHPSLEFFPRKCSTYLASGCNKKPRIILQSGRLRAGSSKNSSNVVAEESAVARGFEWDDGQVEELGEMVEDEEEGPLPWEGAVIYKRSASISHIEYCTTLERLGLGKVSSGVSKTQASELGLRVTKAVKDYPDGTPVLISMDVMKKKQKLRLDGVVRTVFALDCNRCGESAAKSVFSNFSLVLTEEPFEEPETIDMGVIYGEEKFRSFDNDGLEDEDNDIDDQLHFPPEDKEIDISKPIRDILHVEITIDAICDPKCKGICLRCGTNLNIGSCKCRTQDTDEKHYGPLGNLRKQMQQS
ncbi:large ribosomal RNA subunit accumulation protein YCED homolog 1, chloroplastic [Coffea arabica]|uniref:Large ribosomal RNA subunit accumulation protein YCED homolog 1, chloroplastic n=1 Tax=Coffea arabica TaxID=13443 RepID=A0A6P6WR30_COFAR|nr:large ribosomal RNA subunit accumulation protein YCED homolog 1, chloroplastic-like [Coffea arabica]